LFDTGEGRLRLKVEVERRLRLKVEVDSGPRSFFCSDEVRHLVSVGGQLR